MGSDKFKNGTGRDADVARIAAQWPPATPRAWRVMPTAPPGNPRRQGRLNGVPFVADTGTGVAGMLQWRSRADFRRYIMNEDHIKGQAEKVKGKLNEVTGKVTGDKGQELTGDLQQGAGEARKTVGDVKDAAKERRDDDLKDRP
jgi:uncharacterized protein YjbJ (UPF0337 family)